MATLDGIATAVQQLQSQMESVQTRIVAAESLAQTRTELLDNYVAASTNIHKAIDVQNTKISDAVSTHTSDVAILRKAADDVQNALTKLIGDTAGDVTSLQVEVNGLKNESATKESLQGINTILVGRCAGM